LQHIALSFDEVDEVLIESRLAGEDSAEGRRNSCVILLNVVAGLL
jgi:hypothetical protein